MNAAFRLILGVRVMTLACLTMALLLLPALHARATTVSILHSFGDGSVSNDGLHPGYTTLIQVGGNFYGAAQLGGTAGYGTVFEMTPAGTVTILHNFGDGSVPNDGKYPVYTSLVYDGTNFYGTTNAGGSTNNGTVFEMTPAGTVTILHSFGDGTVPNDGDQPQAGLVYDGTNFYGTCDAGGSANDGTVFKITHAGSVTILHSFGSVANDGLQPQSALIEMGGNFYGTTAFGGTVDSGTVFEITPSGTVTILHNFSDGSVPNDGSDPEYAALVYDGTNFYGTTEAGGTAGYGTAFEMTPSGSVTIEYSFGSVTNDGKYPEASLVLATDGNFYGVCNQGGTGTGADGTVFKLTPGTPWTETILHNFNDGSVPDDGYFPDGGLTEGADGNLYGTTLQGGSVNGGTTYKVTIAAPAGGTILAWGFNNDGQLGDGTEGGYDETPVQVLNLTDATAVSAGDAYSLALQSGDVWDWGFNYNSQLDNGSSINDDTPLQVEGSGGIGNLTGIVAISGGGDVPFSYHNLALDSSGHVWAWGDNTYGELGINSTAPSSFPVEVEGPSGVGYLSSITAIAAGDLYSLALDSSGHVWAWGDNDYGQLGNNSTTQSNVPVEAEGPDGVGNLSLITAIACGNTGTFNNVALDSNGHVWTWGSNFYGELGNGTTVPNSEVPVEVLGALGVGTLNNVSAIAGGEHCLAIVGSGPTSTVWTWGFNYYGELGNGTTSGTTPNDVPVEVVGAGGSGNLTGATAIAAGYFHSLAIVGSGSTSTVWAWGDNVDGELGNNSLTNSDFPVEVEGIGGAGYLTGATTIAGGDFHSLAIIGAASTGPTVATAAVATPNPVTGTTTNLSVLGADAAGESTLTYTWTYTGPAGVTFSANGTNAAQDSTATFTQAGTYTFTVTITDPSALTVTSSVIVTVDQTLTGIVVTPQTSATMGLNSTQQMNAVANDQFGSPLATQPSFTWSNTGVGSIGSTGIFSSGPTAGTAHPEATASGVSGSTTITVVAAGTPFDWGWNSFGQLGDGNYVSSPAPVQALDITSVTAVSSGGYDSMVLQSSGAISTWGDNAYGQLGNGTDTNSDIPVAVSQSTGLTDAAAISGGGYHSMALQAGDVWTWGDNLFGQLGNGSTTNSDVPVQVSGVSSVTAISGGGLHSLALESSGQVWAWGNNLYGQTGLLPPASGGHLDTDVPVHVAGLPAATAVSGGLYHSLAVGSSGTVWAWGYNVYGQLGNNSTTTTNVPVQVSGLTGMTAISAGGYHSLALRSDGTVWAWGYNGYGELGNGTTTNSLVPVQVTGLTGITAIATGVYYSLALKSDGTEWAWGIGTSGQLGDGLLNNSDVPVQVVGLDGVGFLTHVTAIAGNVLHSLALIQLIPPTVATAAAASPSPVTGTTTNLSVLGASASYPESDLTYTWTWTGPSGVTFSANGTNAAKDSTATFTQAGTYTFTVTAGRQPSET
ncbi:MAG: choice-of-anchor tandem repeat GloVer-containing protein, partial [Capsulimonadaceae bacterium]